MNNKQLRISVCMIVKNEEKYLDNCLNSIKDIADEIIIVDTGSEDRTMEIAQRYTDKIYSHPWNDSFSEARNHYLNYATGDWIFQIDADEEFVQEDIPILMKAIDNEDIDAVMVQIVSTFRNGRSEAIHSVERIFRNNGIIHYEGRVHNRLVGMKNAKVYSIRFYHYGYDLDKKQSKQKFERTVSLLKMDLKDDPTNAKTYHYLSCSYLSQAMFKEALEASLRAINLSEKQCERNMLYLWSRYNAAMSYYRLKMLDKAEGLAQSGINTFPNHIDSHFILILIYYDTQQWNLVIDHGEEYLRLIKLLKTTPEAFDNLVTCSLNEAWNIHVLIGIAHYELARFDQSRNAFECAVLCAPEPFIAMRAAGIYLYNKNDKDMARSYLQRAQAEKPDDSTVNDLLKQITEAKITQSKRQTISCCMIVKNEEVFLKQCLESVKDYVDEIVIVDTGSTDGTVDIARNYTNKIYFHPWENSFSKARNQALSYVTCDWVFQIDADEELVEGSGPKLRQTVSEAGQADAVHVNIISTYGKGKKKARHNFERLFKNNGVIHYEGIVHNRVVGASCIKASKIEIMHYGYDIEEKKANEKFFRTTGLLKQQILENQQDPMPHHYLGTSYLTRGMYKECAEESVCAIELAEKQNDNHPLYLWSHYNASIAFLKMDDRAKAKHYSLAALEKFSNHLDSFYVLTLIAADEKRWPDVLSNGSEYLNLLIFYEQNPDKAGLIINSTMKEAPGIHLLMGHAYHACGDNAHMEQEYLEAFNSSDEKWRIWWRAGIFHMDHSGDLENARMYLNRALEETPDEYDVWYMLAKLNKKSGLFDAERRCLKRLFKLGNEDTMVLNRLAVLCCESGDTEQALAVLSTVLEKDPSNYNALCSLGGIFKQQNRIDQAVETYMKAAQTNPQGVDPWINMGELSLKLDRYDDGRAFLERALSLQPGHIMALLLLSEIELRQNRIFDFIKQCDLILAGLGLDRNITINTMEDIITVLLEIQYTLRSDTELAERITSILHHIPVDYDHVFRSIFTHAWTGTEQTKKEFFLKTIEKINQSHTNAL
ncbi:MAG: glycosyltransferase [Deltaproteobacteria bacterium]|nr:glycosyltransferase [Deltaproteobacteria bacterium]